MGQIISCKAYSNNEVAYVAWEVDARIDGCLGFEVTRVYLNADGTVAIRDGIEDRIKCASWVAFDGQRNPHWLPQDTGVWPVQKFSWRDLTLRKKRKGMTRRPDEVHVRFEIRPVGKFITGMEAVPASPLDQVEVNKLDPHGNPIADAAGKPIKETVPEYEGTPRKLGYLAFASASNNIFVTRKRGKFQSTFTNGILAAQWLRNVLFEDGVKGKDELALKLQNPDDPHRKYLAGDTLPMIKEFFSRPGEFFMSLYELEDQELEDLLVANADRIHIILSNTGIEGGKWDGRNHDGRKKLIDAGVDIQHRMFNNNTHIGHNKFVVHVPPGGASRSVLTGSTNWTWTGISAQTNNAILIEDDDVADVFIKYYERMKLDALAVPADFGDEMKDNQQSKIFRKSNEQIVTVPQAGGSSIGVWFSPNRQERTKPTSKIKPTPVPPDLEDVYRRIRLAQDAIFFLAFYPAQSAKDCIIGEAIALGLKDRSVLVAGAVSSAPAMPNYIQEKKDDAGNILIEGKSPATYIDDNISIVRASAVDDSRLLGDLGEEQLTPRGSIGAIIHDKVLVIDPLLPTCSVVFGSHNLGFKASYSNDENMIIVSGDRSLAEAYLVHILDVYDHYRFRAVQAERKKEGKSMWSGFLETNDKWQDGYITEKSGGIARYLA